MPLELNLGNVILTCPNFIPVKGYLYFSDDGIDGNLGTE